MSTEPIKNCPKCQAPVPPEAPQGLCPKCLLAAVSVATEAGPPRETQPPPGPEAIRSLFPQLEVLEFIGQGGMGLVYKARQRNLERLVALKLLPQRPGADPSFIERFNREARVLARLSHPNIVAVHDFGQVDGYFYLLMEFVDGVNLRQAMRAGKFTPPQALALVPKICDALQYAHEEGVLHRDIKPENLLLDTRGRLKIADFGIAKLLREGEGVSLTASGAALGTPLYMAPEQLERPHDVDQRADIFSLGVVFYEMLTGELPIGRFAPPSEKAPVDPRVDQVVLRALEKERERRFQSAGEVKTRVENITANPVPPLPQPKIKIGSGTPEPAKSPGVSSGTRIGPPHRNGARLQMSCLLVGLSFLGLLLAMFIVAVGHVQPPAVFLLLFLAAIPGLLGTYLGLSNLRQAAQTPVATGALWRVRVCALAWPVLLCNAGLLLTVLLCARNIEVHVFRLHNAAFTVLATMAGTVGIAALNWSLIREWFRRWRIDPGANPIAEIRSHLSQFPRLVVWSSGPVLLVLWVILFRGAVHTERRYEPVFEPAEVAQSTQPTPPPGYATWTGLVPGDPWSYDAAFSVPAGYVLTFKTTLWSNQVPIDLSEPDGAFMVSPAGRETHGRLTWKLIGNAALADGAPLEFSLRADEPVDTEAPTFHVVTPVNVAVDWVSAPPQLWPPQNGHTRFVLAKGTAVGNPPRGTAASEPTASTSPRMAGADDVTEWVVGLEARVDPIPSRWLHRLEKPQTGLGTNWIAAFEGAQPAEAGGSKGESQSSNP